MSNEFINPSDGQFFARRPPESEKSVGIPLMRAKTKGGIGGIILSETAIGTWTHFFQGRTRPCNGPGCAICAADHARRWHSWVVVRDPNSAKLSIFELPANAALDLDDFGREYGTLRGYKLVLSRPSGKVNGRVHLQISGPKFDSGLLPGCPDLPKILLRMWQVRGASSVIDIFDDPKIFDADDGEEGAEIA